MSDIPNIPEGKKVVKRTLSDGSTEWKLVDDDCWIATAFYGDAYHPEVVFLRAFRNSLLETNTIGPIISSLNKLYYIIGRTRFGKWWSIGLRGSKSVIRKSVSKCILLIAFTLAGKYRKN